MKIEITTFASRKKSVGKVREMSWEELKEKLKHPVVTEESIAEYLEMTNEQRTEIKDVGGFVGGRMKDGKRSKTALENRTVLTIDADDADEYSVSDFTLLNNAVFFCRRKTISACAGSSLCSAPSRPMSTAS